MEQVWETLTGDLRLALLAVGALFLAVLLVWEFVQRRRARRAEETHIAGAYGQSRHGSGPLRDPLLEGRSAGDAAGTGEDAVASWSDDGFVDGVGPVREIPLGSQEASAPAGSGCRREPTFSLPQVAARDRLAEPRVVDLESAIGTPADGAGLLVVDSVTLSDDLSRAQSPFAPAPPETPEAAPSVGRTCRRGNGGCSAHAVTRVGVTRATITRATNRPAGRVGAAHRRAARGGAQRRAFHRDQRTPSLAG